MLNFAFLLLFKWMLQKAAHKTKGINNCFIYPKGDVNWQGSVQTSKLAPNLRL